MASSTPLALLAALPADLSLKAASLPVGCGLLFLALDLSAEAGAESVFLEEVVFLTISLGAKAGTSASTSLPKRSNGF